MAIPPSRTFQQKLGSLPISPFLLSLFFVLHGVLENYHPDIFKDGLELLARYLVSAAILFFLFFWIFKNSVKAAVFSFGLLAFNFFFGSAQDFFKQKFHEPFFMKYSVLVPLTLIFFTVLFFYLRRTKKNLVTFSFYLNTVFIVFILIDMAGIINKARNPPQELDLSKEFIFTDSIQKPDIFLIIADEYAGRQTLSEYFKFDNSKFENELKARGFHVTNNPGSNYNATIYSMSSMFNMDYVRSLQTTDINYYDMLHCKSVIRENNTTYFFKTLGYEFYNHTFFGFADKPPIVFNAFFKQNKKLINSQTFFNRAHYQLGYHFVTEKQVLTHYFNNHRNNITCENLLRNTIASPANKPRFVYTHLALPHQPYYVDSNGVQRKYEDIRDETKDSAAFVQYTIYTNKKLVNIVDEIFANSKKPPVIIIMSDHGWRQFLRPGNERYHFKTLNAVYLPSKNYASFYDGMSNVNQFRAILNGQFRQRLPMLKDSTSFLFE